MSTPTEASALAAARPAGRPLASSGRALAYVVLTVGGLVFSFPLLFMLRTALMPADLMYVYPPVIVAWPPAWQNYVTLWDEVPIPRWLFNSTQITVVSVVAETISSTLTAFGFARVRFRGRDKLFFVVLVTMMLPGTVTLIPQFILYQSLGWVNTFWPLIIPRFFGYAFYIFILRQFFLALPRELDDAAEIDGANRLQILTRIVVPLSGPAIATVAVFSFMNRWNDFLEPVIYLYTPEKLTLAVGLRWFTGRHGTEYHLLMAGALLMTAPMIVAFFLAQKHFVRGIALTGIKG
jgi:multiple sugar transport system permease protein